MMDVAADNWVQSMIVVRLFISGGMRPGVVFSSRRRLDDGWVAYVDP